MRLSVKRNHETVNALPTVSMIALKQKLFFGEVIKLNWILLFDSSLNKTALSLLLCDALGKLKTTHQGVVAHSLRTMGPCDWLSAAPIAAFFVPWFRWRAPYHTVCTT